MITSNHRKRSLFEVDIFNWYSYFVLVNFCDLEMLMLLDREQSWTR